MELVRHRVRPEASLLPQEEHEGEEAHHRQQPHRHADRLEAHPEAPRVLVVHERPQHAAHHAARETNRVARGLLLATPLLWLELAPLDDQGVGHDVGHDLANSRDQEEHRQARVSDLDQREALAVVTGGDGW